MHVNSKTDPLEAILQILNRLERILYVLEDSLKKDQQLSISVSQLAKQKTPISQILLKGWKEYYCFLHLYKLTLNVYMLKEETNVASTSLPRKDKEIIFTGIYNLYKRLIPILTHHHLTSVLEQLADLNNNMYSFHPSFDYFAFYSDILPIEQNLGVYGRVSEIEKKCVHTNILTPLLFGVMNNYRAFQKFIDCVQSVKYAHLLRALLSGLIINFKLRILQYQQVLMLIGQVINKLSLLNKMKLAIITGDLSKDWKQAKDFFISAFKNNYSPGQIQTWILCDSALIQPTILTFLVKGILLTSDFRTNQFLKTLQKQQLQQLLQNEIKELTDGAETLNGVSNNWRKLSLNLKANQKAQTQNLSNQNQDENKPSTTPAPATKKLQPKLLNLIRIINIISYLQQISSQKLLYAIVSVLNSIHETIIDASTSSKLTQARLIETTETLNELITIINRKQPLTNLTQILPAFHKNYQPQVTFEDIVPVYFHSFIMRQAIGNVIDIVSLESESSRQTVKIKQVLTAIVHRYFVKQQHHLSSSQHAPYVTYRSFQKEYRIPLMFTQMGAQTNSVFSNLVKIFTSSSSTQLKKSDVCFCILINLMKHSPQHIIGVLNLPAIKDERIVSFLDWLVGASSSSSQGDNSRKFIIQTLKLLDQFANSTEFQNSDLRSYLTESYYLSVLDSVLNSLTLLINSTNQLNDQLNIAKVITLVELFIDIYIDIYGNLFDNIDSCQKTINNQRSTINDVKSTISPIWSNFIQLLTLLFRNPQFPVCQVNRCCAIYWRILNITKQKTKIQQWYHKLTINRIFSSLTSQNLVFNQTFKGVTSISAVRNYLITKDFNSESTTKNDSNNKAQKPQRHAFADIKTFFQDQFISNDDKQHNEHTIKYSQLKQLREMRLTMQESNKQRKTQTYLLQTDKEMPPFVSSQLLENIYHHYCRSKLQQQQQQQQHLQSHESHQQNIKDRWQLQLEWSLLLLSLNPVNHRNLWRVILKSEHKVFLESMSFTRETINQVMEVVTVLEGKYQKKGVQGCSNKPRNDSSHKQAKSDQTTATVRNHTIIESIRQMLHLPYLHNRVNQLQLLTSSYYFDATKLQTFLQYKQCLWPLIVCNNTNWREFNQHIANFIKGKCLLSTVLQYKEYLSITHLTNDSYENCIQQFSSLIDAYTYYVQRKFYSIGLLKLSDSEKQNQIRKSTLIINVKMLLIKCEVERILEKLGVIFRELEGYGLLARRHYRVVESLHRLNIVCCKLLGGHIQLPSFTHRNLYTTSSSQSKEFHLGRWIEDSESVFVERDLIPNDQRSKFVYIPCKEQMTTVENIEEFNHSKTDQQQHSGGILGVVLSSSLTMSKQQCQHEYLRVRQILKMYLQQQSGKQQDRVSIRHIEKQTEGHTNQLRENTLSDFYCLGHYYYWLSHNNNKFQQNDSITISSNQINNNKSNSFQNTIANLSPILQNLINRQNISLECVKEVNPEVYHHLKLLTITLSNNHVDSQQQKSPNIGEDEDRQKKQQENEDKQSKQKGAVVTEQKKQQSVQTEKSILDQIESRGRQALGELYLDYNKYFALGFINAHLFNSSTIEQK